MKLEVVFVKIGSSKLTSQDAGVVPEVRIQVTSQLVQLFNAVTSLLPEDLIVTIQVELLNIE